MAILALTLRLFQPFIAPLALAFMTAIVVRPVHRWIMARTSHRRGLSATLTVLFVLLVILVPLGVLLAEAFPDNLARRRDAGGEDWLTAGGRGLRLDPASSLGRAEWLAVGEAQGEAKGARITGAIALTEADVLRWLDHRIERRSTLRWDKVAIDLSFESAWRSWPYRHHFSQVDTDIRRGLDGVWAMTRADERKQTVSQ